MRILITGGTGLLGKAFIEMAHESHEIAATYIGDYSMPDSALVRYFKMDVRDDGAYEELFKNFGPEVVVHTAGIGSPDYAEKHQKESWDINVEGTRHILKKCEGLKSKFIYISSNGIYDGSRAPYKEDDAAHPINYYGKIKLEGEKITRSAAVTYGIVRPILMYGLNHHFERSNIVTFALSRLSEGEKVYAYGDVYMNPLYANDCAAAIWKIIDVGCYGTFNIAGRSRVSVYELVRKAAEVFGYDPGLAVPVQQGYFNELVKRPRDTTYDTGKMHSVLDMEPGTVTEGLESLKKEIDRRIDEEDIHDRSEFLRHR